MVLEATMIVVDNSESSRNGDYIPSRWEAQTDLANLIFHSKTQSNPESSVGLMSMGGAGPEVLTTLTTNPGKILDGLHRTRIRGESHLYTGIMIASLALKHRQNKSQRQRIIVLTCSPIGEDKGKLEKLAKKMRKANTSVDIVAFGDLTDENVEKLRAFHEAVNGGDGSHLELVYPSSNLLSDTLVASPILAGEGGVGAAAAASAGANGDMGGAGGGNDFEFVDPNLDPELALVLRMSMEEERERQAQRAREAEAQEGRTALESVPEEGGREGEASETQPLLAGQEGGSSEVKAGDAEEKKEGEGSDRMDTA